MSNQRPSRQHQEVRQARAQSTSMLVVSPVHLRVPSTALIARTSRPVASGDDALVNGLALATFTGICLLQGGLLTSTTLSTDMTVPFPFPMAKEEDEDNEQMPQCYPIGVCIKRSNPTSFHRHASDVCACRTVARLRDVRAQRRDDGVLW